MEYVKLQFSSKEAWIVFDDGEGHQAMLSLNNIVNDLPRTGIIRPAAINALAAELAKTKE